MPQSCATSTLVLGVDDEPLNLKLLKAICEQAGFAFVGARGGTECLDRLQRLEPAVILLDVMLPDLDGFALCRRIRAAWPPIVAPILFLTARACPEDSMTAIDAGGDELIAKPFSPAKLSARIAFWCEQGRRKVLPFPSAKNGTGA